MIINNENIMHIFKVYQKTASCPRVGENAVFSFVFLYYLLTTHYSLLTLLVP